MAMDDYIAKQVIFVTEQERVDWVRIIMDLEKVGRCMQTTAKDTGIKYSTLKDWRSGVNGPSTFERGFTLINYWAEHTKQIKIPMVWAYVAPIPEHERKGR